VTAPSGPRVVLDASAVLAWVLNEPGEAVVDKVLPVSVVPASAVVEVLGRAVERGHRQEPAGLHADLLALGVRVEPLLDGDAVRAAGLIATSRADRDQGSLSLGDGLCVATAERLG